MATVRQPLATQAALEEESGLRASGDSARALLDDPRFTDARPPTGGAGGVLSGGYPDPGFAVDMAEQSELQTEITNRAADVDAEETARIAAVSAEAAARAAADALLIPLAQKGAANGVPTLDAGSKVPISQLPATAINDTFVVASQAAMLALVAERGDVAIRTDLAKTFILSTDSPGTLADWKEILFPTDAVSSVDGRVGTVTLSDLYDTSGAAAAAQAASQPVDPDLGVIAALTPTNDDLLQRKAGAWANRTPAQVKTDLSLVKADVGLGNVDNTSDANKPVSTAQQTALDLKATDALVAKLAGAQTITGKKTFGDASAATVLAASRVTGDTQDRLAWKVGGNLEWGSGAAAADAILSRVTRGLNLAGKLEVYGQNAGDVVGVFRGFTGQSGDLLQAQGVGGGVVMRIDSSGGLEASGKFDGISSNTRFGYRTALDTFTVGSTTLAYYGMTTGQGSFAGTALHLSGYYGVALYAVGAEHVRLESDLMTLKNALNVVLGTATGTKWGTGPTQKQSWWGATPVVQPTAVADAAGGAIIDIEARASLNALLTKIRTIGLIAA